MADNGISLPLLWLWLDTVAGEPVAKVFKAITGKEALAYISLESTLFKALKHLVQLFHMVLIGAIRNN